MPPFNFLMWAGHRFVLSALCFVVIGGLTVTVNAGDRDSDSDSAKDRPTVVISVNRRATELAKSLDNQMRDRRDVSITADSESNLLFARGDKQAIETIKSLLKVMDPPFQTVAYQVSIAVSGEGRDARILDELELSTVDNNKAKIQFGQQVAVPTGTVRVSSNRSAHSYSQQSAGTLVQVQPRISNGKILTDIMLEKSWVDGLLSESKTDSDDANIAAKFLSYTVSLDSTLALQDGVPQTLRAKATSSPGGQRSVVITITATTKSAMKGTAAGRDSKLANRDSAARPTPPVRDGAGRGGAGRDGAGRDGAGRPDAGRLGGVRGVPSRRPFGSPTFGGGEYRPPQAGSRSSQLFSQLDKNNDQKISKKEWDAQSISKVFVDRGFKFSDGMNEKQFDSAMSDMVKSFRQRPTADKKNSDSSSGKNAVRRDDAQRGAAKPKVKARDDQDEEKKPDEDRKKSDRKSDKKPS